MKTLFWCEFPEKVDWKEAKKIINFKTEIYVAVKTRKEYERWKKKIKNKNIEVGAWPKLDENEGYWFSGLIKKESIDKLKEFKGLKIKVDIEPPFPGRGAGMLKLFFTYFIPSIIKKGKNNGYLGDVIRNLNGSLIISGFPLPGWISRRYGDVTRLGKNMEKNFICYTTLTPKRLTRFYLRWLMKRAMQRYGVNTVFAIGCTGKGIFGDERTYKNIEQFKEDIKMVKDSGARKMVVFNIEGIMERKDKKEWLEEVKKVTYDRTF